MVLMKNLGICLIFTKNNNGLIWISITLDMGSTPKIIWVVGQI
jgi:hypothetical protein